MIKNITKGIITTIIGIIFLLADVAYLLFKEPVDSGILIMVAAIGLGLLLSPDDLFKKLKEKV